MSGSLYTGTFRRHVSAQKLVFANGTTSQWLDAATFRSVFCIGAAGTAAAWNVEVQLPSGEAMIVGQYDEGSLLTPQTPRYITINAMCGLPLRFVSSVPQVNPNMWVIFKS